MNGQRLSLNLNGNQLWRGEIGFFEEVLIGDDSRQVIIS